MNYTVQQLSEILGAKAVFNESELPVVLSVEFDSRSAYIHQSTLFVALVGNGRDGHHYVVDAYEKGARVFLVNKCPDVEKGVFLVVEDTLKALQDLAACHRRQFHKTVIGITGSHGKTIVKEWLYQLATSKFRTQKSPKSFNSQLGVPISTLLLEPFHELGIFEAGISQPDEMQNLQKILKPELGIFTNIGLPHQVNFKSFEQKVEEKLLLFQESEKLIYCADHELVATAIEKAKSEGKLVGTDLISWGKHSSATVRIRRLDHNVVELQKASANWSFTFPQMADIYLENALHVVVAGIELGFTQEQIQSALQQFEAVPMRLELKKGANGCLLVNDSYTSDFDSLDVALNYLNTVAGSLKKTLLISDFREVEGSPSKWLQKLNERISNYQINKVLGVGNTLLELQDQLQVAQKNIFLSTEQLLAFLKQNPLANEAILVKGARHFQLERAEAILEEKTHATRMEISLGALRHNLAFYKGLLKPETKMMVMVKAQSYGAGTAQVSRLLQNQGVDYLSVAYIDEGVAMREQGITLPIMVLNPEQAGYEKMFEHDLEPEIYSFKVLDELMTFHESSGVNKPLPIHINLDTGMKRLGFEDHQLPNLLKTLAKYKDKLRIKSIYSHLAASDEPAMEEFTKLQIDRFAWNASQVQAIVQYPILRHISNTAGIVSFPEAQQDMVRLGLGFYGIDVTEKVRNHLQNAATFKTVISQIKEIEPGESVGYSRAWVAKKKSKIATIPVGYADGFDRRLSKGVGRVRVGTQLVPVVGNVCMDMTMIDITGISAQEGDQVIIFDSENTVNDMAKAIGTIPYEILTSISDRVKRVYLED